MKVTLYGQLSDQLNALKSRGLFKEERLLTSPQDALVTLSDGSSVINMCSNNYLGLANDPEVIAAAHQGLDSFGFGMASVRFICGTEILHRQMEEALADFLHTEDAILFPSCFDANGGLFEAILGEDDAIISDNLNHASIIDGIRQCKAERFRYANNDMRELEKCLQEAAGCRYKVIATDGVFSMDGVIADLKAICELAGRYHALVMVDDSHGVGVLGPEGEGSPAHCHVSDKVDILTGTLGKALGGATGGYVAGKKPLIAWLRQRSRPYLFSNSVPPAMVAGALQALHLVKQQKDRRSRLISHAAYFRSKMAALGFTLLGGEHPIIPILLKEATVAKEMADRLLNKGVYVISFSYPVVPEGSARIRLQLSAMHTREQLDAVLAAFASVAKEMGITPPSSYSYS